MKLLQASPENFELFSSFFNNTTLSQVTTFALLNSPKLKFQNAGLCGKVSKTSEITKHAITQNQSSIPDFVIIINEDVFDRLDKQSQVIIIEKLFAQVSFDYEKDVTTILTPDYQEFSDIILKYDFQALQAVRLAINSIYDNVSDSKSNA